MIEKSSINTILPIIVIIENAAEPDDFISFLQIINENILCSTLIIQSKQMSLPISRYDVLGRVEILKAEQTATLKNGACYLLPFEITGIIELDSITTFLKNGGDSHFLLWDSVAETCEDTAIVALFSIPDELEIELIKKIKGRGGLIIGSQSVFANSNNSSNVSYANIVDIFAPVEDFPAQIKCYLDTIGIESSQSFKKNLFAQELDILIATVQSLTGFSLSCYKQSTLIRRIIRRLNATQSSTIKNYLEFINSHDSEASILVQECLIGVTEFFRDNSVFSLISETILPALCADRKKRLQPIRIWIPACSTGEEAYSIALLCREIFEQSNPHIQFQIFATDINSESISFARKGTYSQQSVCNIPQKYLQKYFTLQGNGYRINKEIRNLVVFAEHNLTCDTPYCQLDIISCRNCLIYLKPDTQHQVLDFLNYALNKGGYLILGSSESPGNSSKAFTFIDKRWKIFKKTDDLNSCGSPSLFQRFHDKSRINSSNAHRNQPISFSDITNQILLDMISPPCIMIDSNHDIVFIHRTAGEYLIRRSGKVSNNIIENIIDSLRIPLANSIRAAQRNEKTEIRDNISFDNGTSRKVLRLVVHPVNTQPTLHNFLIIIFQEYIIPPGHPNEEITAENLESEKDLRIHCLERELHEMQLFLQTTVDDLASANEELTSSNEESQSVNEELQSANEELESSKEELQSANEELTTVNFECQDKINELTRLTNDFENFVKSSKLGMIYLDRNLCVVRFTPIVTTLIDLTTSDIGRPLDNFVTRIEDDATETEVQKVLRTGSTSELEVKAMDGKTYLQRILPYRTTSKDIMGVVIVFFDITERKRAEEQLRYHALLVDNAFDAIISTDMAFRVVTFNRSAEQLYGLKNPDVVGKNWYKLIEHQWPDKTPEYIKIELLSKGNWTGIISQIRSDGSKAIVEAKIAIVRDNSAIPIGIVTLNRDITERCRTEADLRASEERLRALFMNMDEFVAMYEPIFNEKEDLISARIIDTNIRIEKLTGQKRDEIIGKTVTDVFGNSEEYPQFLLECQHVLETHKSSHVTIHMNQTNAEHELSIIPWGKKGFAIIGIDVTERKRLEEHNFKTQRLESLGILAGGIAHDFNNLLGGIFGYIEMADELIDCGDTVDASKNLKSAMKVFNRARDLTLQLLTFAKGGAPTRITSDIIKAVIGAVEFALSGSNIKPVFYIKDDTLECHFDPHQIGQVIDNLVINAKQAMPDGGILEISIATITNTSETTALPPAGEYIQISIKDSGLGISQENISKIFDPFFTTKRSGSGLGLTTCWSIIKRHNGHIDVESEIGKGSTFHLYLPVENSTKTAKKSSIVKTDNSIGKILIMDDEPSILKFCTSILASSGHTVVPVSRGEEAISFFQDAKSQDRPFDLAILDLTIRNGMGGISTLQALRDIDPEIAAIASSGYSQDPIISTPKRFGFSESIRKPFLASELLSIVTDVLSRSSKSTGTS